MYPSMDSPENRRKLDEAILDYHLGRLEPSERRRLEAAMVASPEVASRSRSAERLCRLLDCWEVPGPPAGLSDRVVAAVRPPSAAEERIYSFEEVAARAAAPRGGAAGAFLSVRDIVAVAACLAIIVGVMMPGHKWVRERGRRAACQSNLQSVMAGLGGYQADYAGALPFAGPSPRGAVWLRGVRRGVPQVSNTRHFYLLVRGLYVPAQAFYCPSRPDDVPMAQANATRFPDFPQRANCSYSIQNLGGVRPTTRSDPRLAIVGDTNPYFDAAALRLVGSYPANSLSHAGGAGQNVLHLGGAIEWTSEPTVGVDGDNIFQAGNVTRYEGTELPTCATDSFLIP